MFGFGNEVKAAGEGVAIVGRAMDGLFTSDDERLSHEEVMIRLNNAPNEFMSKLTIKEASHRSVFVAGWRPAIGWVCASGIAFSFIVNPLMGTIGLAPVDVPLDAILELVLAMLGLAGLRTVEKINGVAK
jgi:hypothetical protein